MSAGGAKGADERHGALQKGEGSGVGGIHFSRTTAVQDGRQARRPHRSLSQVLEPKSPDSKWTRDLENSRVEEKLRAGEKGARGDIGEGSPAGKHSRIFNSEENDPGDEQPPGGPVPFRESSNRRTAEGVHRRLGSSIIGYSAAIYFHTSDAKISSWTTQAKKMRGSMPPKFEVRDALRTLERAGLENQLPVWDDGRMIVNEGHIAPKADEMLFATRKYRLPYGLEQVERRQEGKELDAAGPLHVALTEYKETGPATPSPLSVDTPGDKRSGPVEDRFRRILERREAESGEESMDETLSEAGEDMDVGNTPEQKPSEEEFTTQELLKDLSGENCADTPTPPLTSSPRKNIELPLTSENPNMRMIFLSAEKREKNTFEGNRDAFLDTLDADAWRRFLSDFNREVDDDTTLDDFKEELWDTVVKFGEPILMGTGLEEKARGELLSKMVELRKSPRKTREDKCKDSSTPKQKTDNKIIEHVRGDKIGTSNIIKSTNILKARAGGRQELKGLDGDKEVESVMITTTPPSKDVRSRKRKRDVEGLGSPSADAVSEKNLRT